MKKYIYISMIVVGILGFLFVNESTEISEDQELIVEERQSTDSSEGQELFYAEIRGEVRYPGVYLVPENSIVRTLIESAGGLNETADISGVNQAEKLEPHSLIKIPAKTVEFNDSFKKQTVFVDIKGEVVNPGVYEVVEGTRVFELIELAGGLNSGANVISINQSQVVIDGMSITIPKTDNPNENLISVQIYGEVKKPGYYKIAQGSLTSDLINLAGGVLPNADLSELNLNKTLVAGEVIQIEAFAEIEMIYVSIKGEVVSPGSYYVEETISVKDLIYLAGGLTPDANISSINYNQTLVLGSIVNILSNEEADYNPVLNNPEGLININTANLDELMSLPGIGEIIGQRIIDYRNEFGYFQTKEDIKLVSGIKDSIYEQIKDDITI
ncbi:MAG: SLBB domain-containing protein [Candidatus Izemoplasmatales bacterium]